MITLRDISETHLRGFDVGRVVEDPHVGGLGNVFPVSRSDLRRHVGEVRGRSTTYFRVTRVATLATI